MAPTKCILGYTRGVVEPSEDAFALLATLGATNITWHKILPGQYDTKRKMKKDPLASKTHAILFDVEDFETAAKKIEPRILAEYYHPTKKNKKTGGPHSEFGRRIDGFPCVCGRQQDSYETCENHVFNFGCKGIPACMKLRAKRQTEALEADRATKRQALDDVEDMIANHDANPDCTCAKCTRVRRRPAAALADADGEDDESSSSGSSGSSP